MPPTALIIGLPGTCRRLQRQLELLDQQPITLGWVLLEPPHDPHDLAEADAPILGTADELESIVARRRPALALITLPAVMASCITSIRTRLRRLGIPDRFMPTLEDQIAGVGPRTQIDIDTTALLQRPVRRIDEVAVRTLLAGHRILITGAGGSIGSELSRIVARYGPAHLTLVDRSENALFEIDRQIARWFPRLPRTALLHDVVEDAETRNHFRRLRPHLVFHAAAHKHVPMMEDHPAAAVDNNFFGTRSVADAADAAGVDRMIMISTDKAVNPSSIMGATKRLAELYVQHINRRSGTGFAMVRFGNVLGSAGSVLESWSRQIAEGGPLTITHPEMTRYFMSIPEAAALVIQAASLLGRDGKAAPEEGEVFLLDMGEPVPILDLARRFIALHGLHSRLPGEAGGDDPAWIRIVFTGPRPGEKLHERLVLEHERVRATAHPDINICILPPPSDRYIESVLETLDPAARISDPAALAKAVRRLIPETAQPVAA